MTLARKSKSSEKYPPYHAAMLVLYPKISEEGLTTSGFELRTRVATARAKPLREVGIDSHVKEGFVGQTSSIRLLLDTGGTVRARTIREPYLLGLRFQHGTKVPPVLCAKRVWKMTSH